MVRIKYSGRTPEYLEGFPEDCERSGKGSIHLLPGSIKDLTEGEYAHVKANYPKLAISKLPDEKKPVAMLETKGESDKVPEAAPAKEAEVAEDSEADSANAARVSLRGGKAKR